MKKFLAVLALFFVPLVFGQLPRPYVSAGFTLMPPGYAAVAAQGGAGIQWNRPYLVFDSYAGYDNGRKANDNTSGNNKGHDRYLRGFLAYKHGKNYFGGGARWSELSTTNYSDFSWHPEAGVGRDWDFMRLQVAYLFPPSKPITRYPSGQTCYGCGSGSHGADISVWFPSPVNTHHLFARMETVLFRYHETATDPSNIQLTEQQVANKYLGNSFEVSLGWKF